MKLYPIVDKNTMQGTFFLGVYEESEASDAAKKEGMERVAVHANPLWMDLAYNAIRIAAESLEDFTSDDVMDFIPEEYDTHERRALGPVMLKAARNGLIVKTGMVRNSKRRSLHASPRQVWRKA